MIQIINKDFRDCKIPNGLTITHNVLLIGEGYEAEPLAWVSFCLLAVIGCPSFGINY